MNKLVTGLSIHTPILRLNFITKLIFIYLSMIFQSKLITLLIYDIPVKTHNPSNLIMDNNIYIFLHITLVASPTADLTPNFLESNCIYPYCKWHMLCSNSINSYAVLRIIIQTSDYMLHHYTGLGKVQLPRSCLDDVLENSWYKII